MSATGSHRLEFHFGLSSQEWTSLGLIHWSLSKGEFRRKQAFNKTPCFRSIPVLSNFSQKQSLTLSQQPLWTQIKVHKLIRQLFASKQLQREVKSNKLHSDASWVVNPKWIDWHLFVHCCSSDRGWKCQTKSFQHLSADSICSADWLWLRIADNKLRVSSEANFVVEDVVGSVYKMYMSSKVMISSWLSMFKR